MNPEVLRRVLVVDDEPNIVNSVRRELKTPPLGGYEVEGYSDPRLALERARSQAFDVVISDYRMPGMTGIEFLGELAAIQPECVPIVLSGQTDLDALTRMVNETRIHRFIAKPWDSHFLKSAVAQAIELKAAVQENARLAALARAGNLPPVQVDESDIEHILIVDDDTDVLKSLSRLLTNRGRIDQLFAAIWAEAARPGSSLKDRNICVHTAWSPQQAIELAAGTEFSCVIADQRMPGTSGVELLTLFARQQPECARILMSGGLSRDDLAEAVDQAGIFGFFAKPWRDCELKSCIAQALSCRRVQRENRLLAEMVRKAAK